MAAPDHPPFENPFQSPATPDSESSSLLSFLRNWFAQLTYWQLLLIAAGGGLYAFSIFSFLTAGFLRQQFLSDSSQVNVAEIFAAPLQGLAGAFIGSCLVISAFQRNETNEHDCESPA